MPWFKATKTTKTSELVMELSEFRGYVRRRHKIKGFNVIAHFMPGTTQVFRNIAYDVDIFIESDRYEVVYPHTVLSVYKFTHGGLAPSNIYWDFTDTYVFLRRLSNHMWLIKFDPNEVAVGEITIGR